jgi:hypothetical protein
MQAEVENKAWNAFVLNDNEFRLQSPFSANFTNGRAEDLILGLPNIKHAKVVSRKNLPPFMYCVYSRTSAGDNSDTGFLAHALSEAVASKYSLRVGSRSRRIEEIELSDMQDMLSNHLAWKKNNGAFESHFISVTSSLLFALQLYIQKYVRMEREVRPAKHMAEKAVEENMKKADKIFRRGKTKEVTTLTRKFPRRRRSRSMFLRATYTSRSWILPNCREEPLSTKLMH